MRRIFLVPALLVLIAGCATSVTSRNYGILLDAWIGASELELIQTWGVPTSDIESSGHRFLSYLDQRTEFVPGQAPTYNATLNSFVGGRDPQINTYTCETTFEIVRGVVAGWTYEGNDCRARLTSSDLCDEGDEPCREVARACLDTRPESLAELDACMAPRGYGLL